MKTLGGDRGIEWGFARENLPAHGAGKRVLDFGPMSGFCLSVDAASKGYSVVAVGLEDIPVPRPDIRYICRDIMAVEFDGPFDYILNVSTTEHVGLGRYGDPPGENFDLDTMKRLRGWMKPDARHILTVPMGQDTVVEYYHRVYGRERLPRLLGSYEILRQAFRIKNEDDSVWEGCTKERALDEVPGQIPEPSMLNLSYALGCFVLCLA